MIEPTLTLPLPRADELRSRVDPDFWSAVAERPLGQLIESTFSDDTVRGLVLTDALIGTFSFGGRSIAAAEPLLPLPRDRATAAESGGSRSAAWVR